MEAHDLPGESLSENEIPRSPRPHARKLPIKRPASWPSDKRIHGRVVVDFWADIPEESVLEKSERNGLVRELSGAVC